MFDLHDNIGTGVGLAISSITTNTATAGAIIDTRGYNAMELSFLSGTITDGTYAVTINESNDAGMAGPTTATVLGTLPSFVAADDNVVKRVGVLASKRYVQATVTSTGVTTGGTMSAQYILGRPDAAPVA